jgi:hypothetical protein
VTANIRALLFMPHPRAHSLTDIGRTAAHLSGVRSSAPGRATLATQSDSGAKEHAMSSSMNTGDGAFDEYGRPYAEPAPTRYAVNAGRLWAGGVAAALVTALTALVGILVVRGVFGVAFLAPSRAGTWGDGSTAWVVLTAAGAALLATAILHVLLVTAPQPFRFFKWIVGLATVVVTVAPFATDAAPAAKITSAIVYLVLGVAIGSLVGGAGARSVERTAGERRPR